MRGGVLGYVQVGAVSCVVSYVNAVSDVVSERGLISGGYADTSEAVLIYLEMLLIC
jgi:hypothetical protein